MIAKYKKGLAALLPMVVLGLSYFGIQLDAEWSTHVVAVVTPLLVVWARNA